MGAQRSNAPAIRQWGSSDGQEVLRNRKEVGPNMKRVKVKGVRRQELDTDQYALALFLTLKAEVERKRERAAREKQDARQEAPNER